MLARLDTLAGASLEGLRVAFIAGALTTGGAEKQLVSMATSLVQMNASVMVCSLTKGDRFERDLAQSGIPVEWVGCWPARSMRLASMLGALRRFRPHIIQAAHPFTNLYAAIAGRVLNAMDIGCLRSSVGHCREMNGRWTRSLLRWPSAMIVNSRSALEELRGVRRMHSYLVLNCTDVTSPPNRPERHSSGRAVAIFVGRLAAVKRADRFLRAFALARASEPTIEAIVVGDGPERASLEKLAANLGLSGSVTFLGNRTDVPDLLDRADILVLTSESEACPNVVLEAMARCVPVVATPVGDLPWIIEDGVSGYLTPPGDVTAIAHRLVTLAHDNDLRIAMGRAGYGVVEREFAAGRGIRSLLAAYREIASRRPDHQVLEVLRAVD